MAEPVVLDMVGISAGAWLAALLERDGSVGRVSGVYPFPSCVHKGLMAPRNPGKQSGLL